MNRKKRRRRVLLVLTALTLLFIALWLLRYRAAPIMREMALTRVSNEASTAINRAVIRQIENGNIAYDRIMYLEKDVSGNISAIRTNIAEVNRLKSDVLNALDEEILEISVSEIGIPVGSVILPALFSGKGPTIPLKIMAVSASDAVFTSRFSQAGINQTLHQILITVSATMTVLTPLGTLNVTTDAQLIAAETVIVGAVPQTYVHLNPAVE